MTTPSRADLVAAVKATTAVADAGGSAADLEAAALALVALLDVLDRSDSLRSRTTATLGSIRRRQWELGIHPDGLDEAIRLARTAAEAASVDPDRSLALANLGNALLTRGDPAELQEAVEAFTQALELSGHDDVTLAAYRMNLGVALTARSRATFSADDLDRGIILLRDALTAARPDDPRRPAYLVNLADALRTRFARAYEQADIEEAVDSARQAAAAQPQPAFLAVLGDVLLSRAGSSGQDDHLDEALRYLAAALNATPERHARRAKRLAGLAAGLRQRAELARDSDDLERAEALLLTAIRLRPERAFLVNLSSVLIRRAELTGNDVLLERAIDIARGADATNLATALHLRAARTGRPDCLEEALSIALRVVAETPPATPAGAALSNLAAIRLTRYLRSSRGGDLDDAVAVARAGVEATPEADPELAGRLSNLGNVLRLRGVRIRSARDLDEAVDVLARAARSARTDRAAHLSNLGAALQSRAEIAGGDPSQAPPVLQAAVDLTPPGSPYRARYLSNLGNALSSAGDPGAAVRQQREALSLLPGGHPDRAVVLGNLAAALEATNDPATRPEAISVTSQVAGDPTANSQDRLLAAWRLADLQIKAADGDVGEGAPAMRTAVELAQRAAWLGVTSADRAYTLTRFSTLALDAAAAIAGRDADGALAALEAGRGVGWQEMLGQRRLDALTARDPELGGRLRAVGLSLDRPVTA
jgi:tetratricopeptide (TPR) repeat protein